MRPITNHAADRQAQRGIKHNYIQLCVRKGTRTNIPNGDPINRWQHKYMYHGLYVICDARNGTVITAYWCAKEDEDIEHCIAAYDELLKNEYSRAENRKKVTKKTQKQERAGSTESHTFEF